MRQEIPPPDWVTAFSLLEAVDDPVGQEVLSAARLVTVPAGTTVFHDGSACQQYMLVLHGTLRVQKTAESGREITLYRVEKGQSCVLTTSCLLAGDAYPAEGITETDVTAVVLPAHQFQRGLDASEAFRQFVFQEHARRISCLILLVEALAFGRVDARLAGCLIERGGAEGVVECTHQLLAAELGTAREVVSRQLKEFERRGWIRLGRGQIELFDQQALAALSQQLK